MGPVQVLVVGFDRPNFSGDVMAEFSRLSQLGIVRLVDLVVLSRTKAGDVQTSSAMGSTAREGQVALALLLQESGAEGPGARSAATTDGDDLWSLADVVPPDSTAAVALIEHVWAERLVNAIRRAGGKPLQESWLAPDDLEVLGRLVARHDRGTVADALLSTDSE